jgi:predicted RNase H-like nuclease (RuvC/YqgF family)
MEYEKAIHKNYSENMRQKFLESARQWITLLHEDLNKLREETSGLRGDIRELTTLVQEMHAEILRLRTELNRVKEMSGFEDDDQEPTWKM